MEDVQMKGTISNIPKKDFKKIYLGIGIGIIVLIVSFTIVLATKIWDPSWNPFQPNPLKILNSSISRISDLEYFHVDFNTYIDVINAGEKIGLEYNISTDVDNNPDVPKTYTDISLGIINRGVKMVFKGDITGIRDIAYLRLKGIPILIQMQLVSIFGVDINQYANKWYKIDPSELGISFDNSINEELNQSLIDLGKKYSVIKFVKKLDSEIINNERTYHYLFRINNEEAKKYILDLFSILKDQVGGVPIDEPTPDEIYAELENLFNVVSPIEFEVWIGKSTLVLYRFRYQKYFDAEILSNKGVEIPLGTEGDAIDISVEFNLSKLNIPNIITEPEEYVNLIDYLFMPLIEQINVWKEDPTCFDGSCVDIPEF